MSNDSVNSEQVYIFDTTLRDGEQSAGISFTTEEKIEIARQLARLNVDIIEAGFPATSPGDLEAVSRIAREVEGPVIAGLARAVASDIDACWEAVQHAEHPRIHVFLSSSDIHMAHQLRKNREDIVENDARRRGPREGARVRCRVLADGRLTIRPRLSCTSW